MKRVPWNKGIKMTKATKRRIGLGRKGKSAWNKGKAWPEKIKKKISKSKKGQPAWNLGRKWSKRVKTKIAKSKLLPEKQFVDFYDVFEVYFHGEFQEIDKWLLKNYPSMPVVNCSRGLETLPTHIRHCLHHKKHGIYNKIDLLRAKSILSKLINRLS